MSLNETDRDSLIKLYWERSERTLADADTAISSQSWNMAANRLYYSVFYAVSALFVKDGCPIKSHRGAKTILGLRYVVTGKVSQETSRIYSQLETLRDMADYDVVFQATKADIMEYRPKVDEFISVIMSLM
ncbi:MAG: HEPN domain-containing protein [Bacteroidales bacterium]|nr:HEPN domain-containing protein [Bacteroidales bacterium]